MRTNSHWHGPTPAISVVMIGHRSAALLKRAISSFKSASEFELVLIVNGNCAEVVDFASELLKSCPFPLAVLQIPECRPGAARNAGVRAARSAILFFLDDDIECFQDIFTAALEIFRNPEIQAAGGANLTPPRSSALARATGGVMRSRLGAASMRHRYRVSPEGPADEHSLILCNLAVRKGVFESEQGFAVHLISNEENVLMQRLTSKKAVLWSSPKLAVYHSRRDTWRGTWAQAVKYGGGRAQNLLLAPETFRFFYFLPALFFLYLVFLPLIAQWEVATIPLAAYLLLAFLTCVQAMVELRDPAQLLGMAVIPFVHIAYGVGFLAAFARWSRKRLLLLEHRV